MGSLELNPFLPLVADCLLENLDLLARAARILGEHCIRGLQADEARCRRGVEASTAAWTALADALGYERAQEISRLARDEGKSVREAALAHGGMTEAEFEELIAPDSVMRLGSPPPEEPE
jgi:aspartate ammonia-lyase